MNHSGLPPSSDSTFLRLRTPRFAHHNIAFSPYFEDRIAVASGTNFGLVGNGRFHIVLLDSQGLRVVKVFDTQDCVYDVAWNESHENQIIGVCGNGAIKLFDTTLEGLPIKAWHEHTAEIMSVDWNNIDKNTFVTSSWDQTVKVWTTDRATSLLTIPAHQGQIYNATFSPHLPSLISTCGADGFLNVFDLRSQSQSMSISKPVQSVPAGATHGGMTEVLFCDWNKYDHSTVATAGKDGSIKIWDLRNSSTATATAAGGIGSAGREVGRHGLAARKVHWSPHRRDRLASVSYDMTCRVWSTSQPGLLSGPCHSQHTEFVMGVAWALFDEGLLASAAWDEQVHLYRV